MSFFIQNGEKPVILTEKPTNPTEGQFYLIKDENGKILYLCIDQALIPVNFDENTMADIEPLVDSYNEILKYFSEVENELYYKGEPIGGGGIVELREVFVYANTSQFPAIGTEQKLYIDMSTGKIYYYSLNAVDYIELVQQDGRIKLTQNSELQFLENAIDLTTLKIENDKLSVIPQVWTDF